MCECNVGSGKFEGESALTFLAYHAMTLGCSDETIGATDFFRAPLDFDPYAPDASDYGYCEECIAEALAMRPYGMSIWESDQGSVYGRIFDTAKAYDKAVAQAGADEADEAGDYDAAS